MTVRNAAARMLSTNDGPRIRSGSGTSPRPMLIAVSTPERTVIPMVSQIITNRVICDTVTARMAASEIRLTQNASTNFLKPLCGETTAGDVEPRGAAAGECRKRVSFDRGAVARARQDVGPIEALSFQRLAVGLQAVAQLMQEPVHCPLAHRMTLRLPCRRQPRRAAAVPPQRSHRIQRRSPDPPTAAGPYCSKSRVVRRQPLAVRATPPHPPGSSSAADASCAVSSCTPARVVVRDIPVAAATRAIPSRRARSRVLRLSPSGGVSVRRTMDQGLRTWPLPLQ